MNRKIMILMVAVVATVLPAVAVADVMITGSVNVSGSNIAPFYIAEGPNYAAANAAGVISWSSSSSSGGTMGTLDLNGSSNQTIEMVNVLYFNYTGHVAGTFYINTTSTSTTSGSFADFYVNESATPVTLSGATFTNEITSGTHNSVMTVPYAFPFSVYISFELPPGAYSDDSFSVSIAFVAS
ncbi:MAG: hypothetical protein ACYDCP_08495 [Thermoplasmataceae archaeon]